MNRLFKLASIPVGLVLVSLTGCAAIPPPVATGISPEQQALMDSVQKIEQVSASLRTANTPYKGFPLPVQANPTAKSPDYTNNAQESDNWIVGCAARACARTATATGLPARAAGSPHQWINELPSALAWLKSPLNQAIARGVIRKHPHGRNELTDIDTRQLNKTGLWIMLLDIRQEQGCSTAVHRNIHCLRV